MSNLRKRLASYPEIDYLFLLIVFATVCVGLVMLLSASGPAGKSIADNSYHFFKKQLIAIVLGFIGMAVASYIDYHDYAIRSKVIYAAGLVVLIWPIANGLILQGARRWIQLPGFQVQPSEIAKLTLIIYLSAMIMSGKYDFRKFKQMKDYGIAFGVYALLLILEPHLSGTVILFSIAFVLLVCAQAKLKPIILVGIAFVLLAIGYAYFFSPLRWARITTLIDPFASSQGDGYQVVQSVSAIGSGGLFGKGLGQSVQKYGALPEPYNDFIFSVICEELGLIGGICVMLLFIVLILKALQISVNAPDTFGRLIGIGITTQIAVQVVFNIGVATSTIPNTGISLPFFSYGGSSIIMLLIEMGILLNISRQINGMPKPKKQKKKRSAK